MDKQLLNLFAKDLSVEKIAKITGKEEEEIKEKSKEMDMEVYYDDFKKEHNITKEDYSVKRWRKRKIWDVANRYLFGLIVAEELYPSDIAEIIDVTTRSVERWVFEGCMPSKKNQKALANYFQAKREVLFGDNAYKVANKGRLKENKDN